MGLWNPWETATSEQNDPVRKPAKRFVSFRFRLSFTKLVQRLLNELVIEPSQLADPGCPFVDAFFGGPECRFNPRVDIGGVRIPEVVFDIRVDGSLGLLRCCWLAVGFGHYVRRIGAVRDERTDFLTVILAQASGGTQTITSSPLGTERPVHGPRH